MTVEPIYQGPDYKYGYGYGYGYGYLDDLDDLIDKNNGKDIFIITRKNLRS